MTIPEHHRLGLEPRIAVASWDDLAQYARDAALDADTMREHIRQLELLLKLTCRVGRSFRDGAQSSHDLIRSLNKAMRLKAHGKVREALERISSQPGPSEFAWPDLDPAIFPPDSPAVGDLS